ncbi:MAG TPA: hypothetical protein ENN17_00290 [bacterium]|nr:hypothetical protein [bacterium]
MGSIPDALTKTLIGFEEDVRLLFGDHTVSIILYGSAATDEFVSGKSDINILVVLDEDGIENLEPVQKKVMKWLRQGIRPLFLTETYIERSLDSFPIEFLNMQTAYHVVSGKDVLEKLDINRKDLRLECERELKGKLLQLRQEFVMTRGKRSALKALIRESAGAFTAIFRALLFLAGQEIPAAKQEVIRRTCEAYRLDESLFLTLFAVKGGKLNPSRDELERLVASYIRQIAGLSREIDKMEI